MILEHKSALSSPSNSYIQQRPQELATKELWTKMPKNWHTMSILSTCSRNPGDLFNDISSIFRSAGTQVLAIDTCNSPTKENQQNSGWQPNIFTKNLGIPTENLLLHDIPTVLEKRNHDKQENFKIILLLPSPLENPYAAYTANKCGYILFAIYRNQTRKSELTKISKMINKRSTVDYVFIED